MIPYLRLLFGGLLLAVLAACAGIPSDRSGTAQDQKAAALAEIPPISAEQPFHRQGRVAVHAERMNDKPERSEEHTPELQSRGQLVCRLLLEKKTQIGTESTSHVARTGRMAKLQ